MQWVTCEDWFSSRSVSSQFLFSCTRAGTTKGGCWVQRLFTSREVLTSASAKMKLHHQPRVLQKPGQKLTPVQVYKSLLLFKKSISKLHLWQKHIGCHLLHWRCFSLDCATRVTPFWRDFISLDGNTFATSYICSPFSFRVNLAGQRLWGSLFIPRLRGLGFAYSKTLPGKSGGLLARQMLLSTQLQLCFQNPRCKSSILVYQVNIKWNLTLTEF